jgi:hypothetical protein
MMIVSRRGGRSLRRHLPDGLDISLQGWLLRGEAEITTEVDAARLDSDP